MIWLANFFVALAINCRLVYNVFQLKFLLFSVNIWLSHQKQINGYNSSVSTAPLFRCRSTRRRSIINQDVSLAPYSRLNKATRFNG